MRNADLLRKVADQIEREPKLYDQSTYGRFGSCGSVCCIAGWADRLSGIEFGHWGERAVYNLGISRFEANILFSAGWSPRFGMTVPQALRLFADGADILEVSQL